MWRGSHQTPPRRSNTARVPQVLPELAHAPQIGRERFEEMTGIFVAVLVVGAISILVSGVSHFYCLWAMENEVIRNDNKDLRERIEQEEQLIQTMRRTFKGKIEPNGHVRLWDENQLSLGKPELMDTPTLIEWIDRQLRGRPSICARCDFERLGVKSNLRCENFSTCGQLRGS